MTIQFGKVIAGAMILVSPFMMSSAVLAADTVLVDKSGMTLYTFDKDSNGTSNCYGGCAKKWPPFIMEEDAREKMGYSTTTRNDGVKQWTYNDQPLYTWVGDKKQGDVTGDGVGGVWHTAKKSGY